MAGKPPGDSDIVIGRNLRRLRKRAGLTQRDLGVLFGVSAAQAQKFETGRNRLSYERALLVCTRIGVAVEELFGGVAMPARAGLSEAPQAAYLASDPWMTVADALIAAARDLDASARSRIALACRRVSESLG